MENSPFKITQLKDHGQLSIGGKVIQGITPGSYPLVHAQKPGLHIVLFWMTGKTEKNVKAYDSRGELIWIAEPAWIGLDESRRIDHYFAMGWDSKRNCIVLGTYYEQTLFLNHENGSVSYE